MMADLAYHRFARLLLAAALAVTMGLAPVARAQLKGDASAVEELDAVVTLVAVDRVSRTVVLRGADGIALNVTLPREVHTFERAKPGDLFALHYAGKHGVALNKGGVAGVSEQQAVDFVLSGSTPIARFTTTRRVTLRVQQVNRTERTVAVQDADNRIVTVSVEEGERGFGDIAVGDTISIISTDTLELQLVSPGNSPRLDRKPISDKADEREV